jgi:hypothetical protein
VHLFWERLLSLHSKAKAMPTAGKAYALALSKKAILRGKGD